MPMLPKIQIATPDGVGEYICVADGAVYEQAKTSGDISPGMDIVYRSFLVHILPDMSMLVLTRIQQMPPQFVNHENASGAPNAARWSFSVNGVPVDPEQFMGGAAKA